MPREESGIGGLFQNLQFATMLLQEVLACLHSLILILLVFPHVSFCKEWELLLLLHKSPNLEDLLYHEGSCLRG